MTACALCGDTTCEELENQKLDGYTDEEIWCCECSGHDFDESCMNCRKNISDTMTEAILDEEKEYEQSVRCCYID